MWIKKFEKILSIIPLKTYVNEKIMTRIGCVIADILSNFSITNVTLDVRRWYFCLLRPPKVELFSAKGLRKVKFPFESQVTKYYARLTRLSFLKFFLQHYDKRVEVIVQYLRCQEQNKSTHIFLVHQSAFYTYTHYEAVSSSTNPSETRNVSSFFCKLCKLALFVDFEPKVD